MSVAPPQLLSQYPALPPPVRVPLVVLAEHTCNYLPDRMAQTRAFWVDSLPAELYHQFMDAGFRRSGKVIYQPVCRGCRECVPIRVPVDRFEANKSQRRCRRRNQDLTVSVAPPLPDDESYGLYRCYQTQWHGSTDNLAREDFEAFLYDSPVDTLEFKYRDPAGELLAVGICDVSRTALSSVYYFYQPSALRRGLGIFGALREIEFALARGIQWYYLGYWVAGCRRMHYKRHFFPSVLLRSDGIWHEIDAFGDDQPQHDKGKNRMDAGT